KGSARLRQLALGWLRADLEAWGRLLEKAPDKARTAAGVAGVLRQWQEDGDLAGVRGAEAIGKLPEAERQPGQKLWADVADALARMQRQAAPPKEPDSW